MNGRPGAPAGGASRQLAACGAVIAATFWTIAWLGSRPGETSFLLAIGAAAIAYARAALIVTSGAPQTPAVVGACLALALAWRLPMLALPADSAHDAVRYIWDARVVAAGLDPYSARPDDPALAALHTEVTRQVDAAWLPAIYPPAAQVYGLAVTAIGESIAAFRAAALLADAAVMAALVPVLRSLGRPAGWTLLYAWHPLGPLEGAAGAHLEYFGVLLLVLAWLAILRGRSMAAAAAYTASVLVKPLPLVLAPLLWRRIRLRDAAIAAAGGTLLTAWIARGSLPVGSTWTFVETFRFNGPAFDWLERALPPGTVAGLAVLAGLGLAVHMRRTRAVDAPEAWLWPMAVALALSPVIYPWYLIWLLPFAFGRNALPAWIWTLSVLTIYPVWQLHRLGGSFEVPATLLVLEFAAPAIAGAILLGGSRFGNLAASAFRRKEAPASPFRLKPEATCSNVSQALLRGKNSGNRLVEDQAVAAGRDARVTVVVPALDEAGTIGALIERLPCPARQAVVVDNGSSDGTPALAAAAGARVVHAARRGYGRACLAGIAAAPGSDVFAFLDADLSERPEELPRLIDPILRGEADLVLGCRAGSGRLWHARAGTTVCVWLINRLWSTRYRDLGPYRAIRRSSLDRLAMRDRTWGWTIEMQVKAAEQGLRTLEVPVTSGDRLAGQSKISGSLSGTIRAAGRMLETIARLRWTRARRAQAQPRESAGAPPGQPPRRQIPVNGK